MIERKTYLPLAAVAALGLVTAGCIHDDGPVTTPKPEPDPAAVAGAIDLVASWATRDANDNPISGWWFRDAENESGNQEHLSHSHRDGSSATPVISYDADGPQFNVGLLHHGTQGRLQTETGPWARATRYVTTNDIGDDPEGVTTSRVLLSVEN